MRPAALSLTGSAPEPATSADLVAVWAEAPRGAASLGRPSFLLRTGERSLTAVGEVLRRTGPGALLAAAGASIEHRGEVPQLVPGPFVTALPFRNAPGPEWAGLAAPLVLAPELLHVEDGDRAWLGAFARKGRLQSAQESLARGLRKLETRVELPRLPDGARLVPDETAQERWNTLLETALATIARGDLTKVVLARALEVELSAEPDPHALAQALWSRYPSCRTFWLQGDGCAFAGATPETFASLEGRKLRCDALAGTAAPGKALLGNDKDLREHRAVVDDLRARMAPIAESVEVSGVPRLLKLHNVDHLQTQVTAQLRPGVGLPEVAATLHPTPAVGGAPREPALRFIAQYEGLDRGLYAGLLGFVGPERAELHVALRCALLRGTRARLFAGAGIVAGSSAASEWEETALKAQAFLSALGVKP